MDTVPPLSPTQFDRNSFSRQAAKASRATPLLIVVLIFLCRVIRNQGPGSRVLIPFEGFALCLLMANGLIFGILALVLMKPGGRGSIIRSASVGILLNGLLAAVFIPNFVRAREQALARRKAYEDIQAAGRDYRKEAIEAMKEGRPDDPSRAIQSLENAAKSTAGDTAALMKGLTAYTKKIQALEAALTKALDDLSAAHVLRSSDLTQREQLQSRKAVVEKYLAANDAVKNFFKFNEENFRKELVNQNVSPAAIESALEGFRKKSAAQTPLELDIRETNTRMAEAILGVLNLLDADWGQWHYDAASGKLNFNDAGSLDKYNAYLQEINSAKQDETADRRKLTDLMSQQESLR